MKAFSYLSLLLVCLVLQPVIAQDGCGCDDDDDDDGCSEIEIGCGDGGAPSRPKDDEFGPDPEDDPNAPKVKLTLQQRINKAIEDGVAWLKRNQKPDGDWGPLWGSQDYSGKRFDKPRASQHSGPTSLTLYTLSKCGVSKKDKTIRKGYKWLQDKYRKGQIWTARNGKPEQGWSMTTYEIAALIMALESIHERSHKLEGKHRSKKKSLYTKNPLSLPNRSKFPKDDWRWMHEGIVYLTEGVRASPGKGGRNMPGCQTKAGGWRYGQAQEGNMDLSATQFVLLGLRAASQAGYPVKAKVWFNALKYVRSMQAQNGAFGYQKGKGWSNGMTAAGVACAVICKEQLERTKDDKYPVPSFADSLIKKGLARLDETWDVRKNQRGGGGRSHGSHHYYYLYAVERVGDLTGRKEFNGKDWYVRGAKFLLSHQAEDGKWVDTTAGKPADVLGTCFALLFLKRSTIPTVTSTGN